MGLTRPQKSAGRAFLGRCQAALDELNSAVPDGYALPLWRVYRHDCPSQGGASIGIDLHEHYETSQRYVTCCCGSTAELPAYRLDARHSLEEHDCGPAVLTPAGFFAFIWKDGRCPDCGLTVRSQRGLLVLAADRPPAEVRAVAGQAGAHPGDQ
jgi:hypothetical protein